MADWRSLQIQVPGKDLLEPTRNALETLVILLDVLKTILDTIKVFLIDYGNAERALVEALIRLIEELFASLKTAGAYGLFHVPDPIVDPNFNLNRGFDRFPQVFKASLFDPKDPNRPQPRPGSTTGGFVLLMVQADRVSVLLSRVKQLLRFFSREFTTPRYAAPSNFKVSPVGGTGDPILSVATLFASSPIEAVSLTWTLPTSQETPEPGFSDLVSRNANEFIPSKYLIEKSVSVNPYTEIVQQENIRNAGQAGKVEYVRTVATAGGADVEKREYLTDSDGELVVKFTDNIILDELAVESLLGQLGTFRYIDRDIEAGVQYYYRVRAFSGDLDLTSDRQINWGDPEYVDSQEIPKVRWPSASTGSDDLVIAGKPTGIVSVRIPNPAPANFNVVDTLNLVFQAAISCDFHRELLASENPTDRDNIGKGSLNDQAGMVSDLEFGSQAAEIASVSDGRGVPAALELLGVQEYPWENFWVRRQSAKLADTVASAMLEAVGNPVETFRAFLQNPDPVLPSPHTAPTLEQALYELSNPIGSASFFLTFYYDAEFRTRLLEVVQYLKSFTLGGAPPDWISINPLRDIIPWSGQIIYTLLDKIQALLDAFGGVNNEINNFINMLEQKISTLERNLQFLISILNFIESLQIGAYVLVVPEISGDATAWAREVDVAQGTIPNQSPGGYSAGVALAYLGPDVTAFKTAFEIIFGT